MKKNGLRFAGNMLIAGGAGFMAASVIWTREMAVLDGLFFAKACLLAAVVFGFRMVDSFGPELGSEANKSKLLLASE